MSKLACIGATTLILLLEACGANDTLEPPIALPHTVAQVSGIVLSMDRQGERGELVVHATCASAATDAQITRVSVEVATRAGSTTSSYSFEDPAPCPAGKPFLTHAGSGVSQLEPGARLRISLTVERPKGASAISQCYEQGRDGALHDTDDPTGCLPDTSANEPQSRRSP